MLDQFTGINDTISPHPLKEVVTWVKKTLAQNSSRTELRTYIDFVVYTGGELDYMQRLKYELCSNDIFEDTDHPFLITLDNFKNKNEVIFKTSIQSLKKLMPENPNWMIGARPCSAIAQAIFEIYKIDTIIPSDSNIMHGAARGEFNRLVISGSLNKNLNSILALKDNLETSRIEVLSPNPPKSIPNMIQKTNRFVLFHGQEDMDPLDIQASHFDAIQRADALVVCNTGGYIGPSTFLELGFAQALNKRVIFTEAPNPEEIILSILPHEVGML